MRIILPITCCLLFAAGLRADWIELKDGTRIEGDISSVTTSAILIEVQTTPSIREEKSYPRTDVAKFQRATQDDIAFAELTAVTLPTTADSPEAYETDLPKNIAQFMTNYPYSKHLAEARKLAADIESEKARVTGGEVKIEGEWFTADAVKADTGDLAGRIQLAKMKQAPDPASALVVFDMIERTRNASSSYPEAIRLAREQITALKTAVTRMRAELQSRRKQQEEGLTLASEDRRAQLKAGIEQEKTANLAKIETAKRSGSKWPPLVAEEVILVELDRLADSERTRLASIEVESLEAGLSATREAATLLDAGDLKGARESLDRAKKLWGQYNQLSTLEAALKKAETAAPPAPTP